MRRPCQPERRPGEGRAPMGQTSPAALTTKWIRMRDVCQFWKGRTGGLFYNVAELYCSIGNLAND